MRPLILRKADSLGTGLARVVLFAAVAGMFLTAFAPLTSAGVVDETPTPQSSVPTTPTSVQVNWVQCENDGNNDNVVDTPMCNWVTGDLNRNNALLTEGNNPPPYPPGIPGHVNYRAIFEGLIAGQYELTISYEFTKGGKAAFDFLTTNHGVTDANLCDDLPGGVSLSACNAMVPAGLSWMTIPLDPESLPPSLGGGTVKDRQNAHDTAMSAVRTMKVYGATITGIGLFDREGSASGDSHDKIQVNFTKPSGEGSAVIVAWGGHFGIGAPYPVGYGAGNGAGSVSGAPFHMILDGLARTTEPVDSSVVSGSRDRSVQLSAITFQQITIVKDAVPDDPQDFEFAGSTGIGTFFLDDDPSDTTLPNSRTFSLSVGIYSVSEIVPPGWTLTSATCSEGSPSAIDLGADKQITCTFVNEKRASLIIAKNAVPDDPQDFEYDPDFGPNFFLDDDPSSQTPSQKAFDLAPGTYAVAEVNLPADWDLTGTSCTDGSSVDHIELSAGETVTCTFTNTKRGKIIVEKQTVPDGATGTFDFTGDVSGSIGDGGTIASGYLVPGTYHATESDPTTAFDLTSISCNDGDSTGDVPTRTATFKVAPGETVKCTFTNTKRGKIIVEKQTIPDGELDVFKFTGALSGVIGDNDQLISDDLAPGTYYVEETDPTPDYDLTSIVCDDNDSTGSTSTRTATYKLDPGETVKCVFTNTKRAKLIVEKQTLPDGSGESFSFSGAASGSIKDGEQLTAEHLVPGTHLVTEDAKTGWDLVDIDCDDSDSTGDTSTRTATYKLGPGETVKCVFTNRQRAKLIVEKQTNPDGAQGSFTFSGVVSGSIGDGGQLMKDNLVPGTYYATEADPTPAFDLTAITCDDGNSGGNLAERKATFVLEPGETVKCVFTNTKRGNIVVDKVTLPAGDPQSFSFSLNGGPDSVDDDFSLTDVAPPHDSGYIKPGTYSVEETVPAGWDKTSATCTDGSPVDAIVLSAGESVTCTFTNTKRGKILVDKVTIPSKDPQSFDFTLKGGPDGIDQAFSLTDAAPPHDSGLVKPGTYVAEEEIVPEGWDKTSATCSDGSSVDNIILNPGETVTCTFTNTKRGRIYVDKVTIPSGESQVFWFSLTGGPDGIDQDFSLTDASDPHDSGLVKPGTYAAEETVPTGWDQTGATCSDGSVPSSIKLDAGEEVTCTFENTKRGKVTILKETIPDGDPTEFDYEFAGVPPEPFKLKDGGSKEFANLELGTYTAAELAETGWDLTNLGCKADTTGFTFVIGRFDVSGKFVNGGTDGFDAGDNVAQIKIAAGGEGSCTYTNTERGQIFVDKVTIPSKDPQSFDFTLTGGPDSINQVFSLTDAAAPHDSGYIRPGTYVAAETVPTGWDKTGATCSDGSPVTAIVVEPGETITCTFTNTKRGQILVDKVTIPSGYQTSFDFTLTGPGGVNQEFSLADQDPLYSSGYLKPGTYEVDEDVPTGWDLTSATCSDGSDPDAIDLSPGEVVTCVFTNTKRGKVIVAKETIPDGMTDLFTFTGVASGSISDGGKIEVDNVVPGQYPVTETDPTPEYDLTSISCDDGGSTQPSTWDLNARTATFNVEPGETVTCTFENTKRSKITIVKESYKGDATFKFVITRKDTGYPIDVTITTSGGYGSETTYVLPGLYSVTELLQYGWTLISASCDGGHTPGNIDLGPGEEVTCRFVNFRPSMVTDSALCDFDRDPSTPEQDIRLIFHHDPENPAGYRVTASNPGQFYYHVFKNGNLTGEITLTVQIPYPFVTQGARPIHFYDSVTVKDNCFIPGNEVEGWSASIEYITLDSYTTQAIGEVITFTISGVVPDTGVIYMNIHLDYGLKKTGGYNKNTQKDATDLTTGEVVIANHAAYSFAFYFDGSYYDGTTVYTFNDFKKKDPGFYGKVWDEFENGVPGVTVEIYDPDDNFIGAAITDEDGIFIFVYKHHGPEAMYKLVAVGVDMTLYVPMTSSGIVWVDFIPTP